MSRRAIHNEEKCSGRVQLAWGARQMGASQQTGRHEVEQVPDRPSNLAVIEACSLFNALIPEERRTLADASYVAYAERGEFIWVAGALSHFAAVVGTGFIKMTRTTPQGSEVAVELLGPGQAAGLLSAIEGRVYPLSAVAVTDVWYLKVPVPALLEVYRESAGLRDQVLRSLAPRLRKAHDMMARMSTCKVEHRIAAVLIILMLSYGEKIPEGTRLTVPLTRADLAEMAGTTVETAIRVMSRWQKEGVVSTDHQVITILKPQALDELLLG